LDPISLDTIVATGPYDPDPGHDHHDDHHKGVSGVFVLRDLFHTSHNSESKKWKPESEPKVFSSFITPLIKFELSVKDAGDIVNMRV